MTDDVSTLKTSGLKITDQRLKILEFLRASDERHFSAESLYMSFKHQVQDIGIATIYRTLAQFEEAGILERLQISPGKALFELKNKTHHDHLVCLRCGYVEEFFDEQLEAKQTEIADARNFSLQAHHLNLFVNCKISDCERLRSEMVSRTDNLP